MKRRKLKKIMTRRKLKENYEKKTNNAEIFFTEHVKIFTPHIAYEAKLNLIIWTLKHFKFPTPTGYECKRPILIQR